VPTEITEEVIELEPEMAIEMVTSLQSAVYVYDGDGNLVKSIINEVVTYYAGRHYHKTVDGVNETVKKYYSIGMSQVAVRTNGELNWILTDHLSSASVIANADGTMVSEVKYSAFGEIRSGSGDMPTKYQYTGQLSQMAEIGLHYFVARWMDPVTGHFVSADSIVPQPGAVHDWNRYAFGRYNPIIYTDPSGHCSKNILMDDGWCPPQMSEWQILSIVSIKWEGEWSNQDKAAASKGALNVAKVLGEVAGGNIYQTFKKVFGPITFSRQKTDPGYWGIYNDSRVTFFSGAQQWDTLVPHELGHAFNARIANNSTITTPYNLLHTRRYIHYKWRSNCRSNEWIYSSGNRYNK
jgi:RHS repeat-associated protein